jgi:chromosome segregation ATPase
MVKGKRKNLTKRNQNQSASSESSKFTTASSGYPNTPEEEESDSKSYLMMLVENFKKGINNSLKEIQENTAKLVKDLKEETQNSLKELQENTREHVMELNKTIQDLKREVETIKKAQRETTLEIEILGKKSGTIDVSINNRIQEMEERMSGAEDTTENMETTIKENAKYKEILTQYIQEFQDTMRKPNKRIIGIDENEHFQLEGPANIFIKIIEENFPDLKGKGRPIRITSEFSPETMKARRSWADVKQTLGEN